MSSFSIRDFVASKVNDYSNAILKELLDIKHLTLLVPTIYFKIASIVLS